MDYTSEKNDYSHKGGEAELGESDAEEMRDRSGCCWEKGETCWDLLEASHIHRTAEASVGESADAHSAGVNVSFRELFSCLVFESCV